MARKCQKTRKASYSLQKQARRAMMRIISHDPNANMFDLHTYQCESCGGWHIGHKSYYERSLHRTSIGSRKI